MEDIFIRIAFMPCGVKGITCKDSNGDYNIYINEYLNDSEKIRACLHEMRHIHGNHFDFNVSAKEAELDIIIQNKERWIK